MYSGILLWYPYKMRHYMYIVSTLYSIIVSYVMYYWGRVRYIDVQNATMYSIIYCMYYCWVKSICWWISINYLNWIPLNLIYSSRVKTIQLTHSLTHLPTRSLAQSINHSLMLSRTRALKLGTFSSPLCIKMIMRYVGTFSPFLLLCLSSSTQDHGGGQQVIRSIVGLNDVLWYA